MRKYLIAVALVLMAAVVHGQTFEGLTNPNVVAGASYRLEDPGPGVSRMSFMLSANIVGPKLGTLPLYLGGVGVDVRTIDPAFEQFGNALSMSVPGLTYFFNGNKVCAQVGYSYALSSDAQARNGMYAGIGFTWNSPNELKAKREAKKAAAAKAKP